MKLLQLIAIISITTLFSNNILAGVFKCTDSGGATSYQSSPCAKEKKAVKIDIQTGGATEIPDKEKQKGIALELIEQQKQQKQQQLELEVKRKKDTEEQSALNQQLIKNNPIQYSAFSIPPYDIDNLAENIKPFIKRLPEVEKFRRIAAQTALATGKCIRVEADELNIKSKPDKMVFSVDCSSTKTFSYTEEELSK